MQLWVQQLVNGLLLGGMYALMSVGLSMVFGLMKTANFAYGGLYMLGGYCAYWAAALLALPYGASLALAFCVMFGVGVLVERLGFAPLRGNEEATLIFGLGLALVIRGGAVLAWGSQARVLDAPMSGALHLGWLVLPTARLWACGVSLLLLGMLYGLVRYTRWGRIVRALADNPARARLLGIDSRRHHCLVSGLGTALSAVACVFLIPVLSLSPAVDDSAMYTAFAVVILGGLGSIPGCLLGAMILVSGCISSAAFDAAGIPDHCVANPRHSGAMAVVCALCSGRQQPLGADANLCNQTLGLVSTLSLMLTDSLIAPAFPLLILLLVLMFKPEGLSGQRGRMA